MNRKEILEQAGKCVNGARQDDYGTPENSFACIAELWNVYLAQRVFKTHTTTIATDAICANTSYDGKIHAADVAAMLALLKIARIATGHGKSDNWVDLAGYAACGGEIESTEVH